MVTVLSEELNLHVGIELAEEGRSDFDARDNDRLARVHLGRKTCIGGDRRGGGDVATLAEVLGEDSGYEVVKVEAIGKRHDAPLVRVLHGIQYPPAPVLQLVTQRVASPELVA